MSIKDQDYSSGVMGANTANTEGLKAALSTIDALKARAEKAEAELAEAKEEIEILENRSRFFLTGLRSACCYIQKEIKRYTDELADMRNFSSLNQPHRRRKEPWDS